MSQSIIKRLRRVLFEVVEDHDLPPALRRKARGVLLEMIVDGGVL
ncbi:hypothetical protein [Terriglobus roseus]|uniref:Uncharacterized protein n=1 Tax=Terriglobus roseus TaxID=392734 RepID=A0A1G7GDE2_9BACT|nr:hypothetical protein [Terriglobus roseus]SDE86144.1 hypothetical protein SAMN05444167_0657 [Terriglobus roseus]